jgi:uncharacterized membrane protein YccF (DUF307 family)
VENLTPDPAGEPSTTEGTGAVVPAEPPAGPPPVAPAPPASAQTAALAPPVVVVSRPAGPGLLLRAAWFLLVGWWLSSVAIGVAYVCCLTIIGLPLGFIIFNRLPVILTLRPRTDVQVAQVVNGVTYVGGGSVAQLPILVRGIWFVLVGWWLGAVYMAVAWFLCVILITLPVGLWLFNRVGAVMTLLRY